MLLWAIGREACGRNVVKRNEVLKALGLPAGEKRTLVGFFHPYWYVLTLYSEAAARESSEVPKVSR